MAIILTMNLAGSVRSKRTAAVRRSSSRSDRPPTLTSLLCRLSSYVTLKLGTVACQRDNRSSWLMRWKPVSTLNSFKGHMDTAREEKDFQT